MAFHNVPPNGFPDLPDVEELEAVIKDVTNLKTSVVGLSEDVSDLNDNKANQITIAPFFNPETAYEVGDLVYYNGLTYRCTNAHEGEWDADDFSGTTIANELSSLMSGLTNLVKRGTVDVTIASGATTGSAYLRVDTVIIARDRMVGVLIGKNDDVYYNPVIISVHNDGAIEARAVGDAPTTSRTYNVIVSYI